MHDAPVLLGVIGRPHGVRGLVRVVSYTDPPEALAEYGWLDAADGRRFSVQWRGEGLAELTLADGTRIADRTAAERLTNLQLFVPRARLAPAAADEFYLADLIGLDALDASGTKLGVVRAVHDYGAGASLEILPADGAPLLVPFTRASVPEVDLAARRATIAVPAVIEARDAAAPSRDAAA